MGSTRHLPVKRVAVAVIFWLFSLIIIYLFTESSWKIVENTRIELYWGNDYDNIRVLEITDKADQRRP